MAISDCWFGFAWRIAHASKPLLQLGINLLTGWPYGSILYGILYPLTTRILRYLGAAAGPE
ncbi:MAG: hypothetical protein U0175_32695 [Caldilineaceae bacterium]